MPDRSPRRFHAFCVGLPKTGTTSVGTIFEGYRSSKIAGSSLERLGCDLRDRLASPEQAQAFIAARDAAEQLEMDPASANWMVADLLAERFPEARFILTIRDCYSWCDSMLNVIISRDIGVDFIEDPVLFGRLVGCDLDWFRDEATVLQNGDAVLDGLLKFWARQAATLAQCPTARRLVVRTGEISSSVEAMADFVGVPRDTLRVERSHSRITERKFDILGRLDRARVRRHFAAHAGSDVMKDHFPGVSLESFLEKSAKPTPRRAPQGGATAVESKPRAHSGAEADPEHRPELVSSAGFQEMARALTVIRSQAESGVAQRSGFSLDRSTLETRDGTCYALLSFANRRRAFVLEVGLRDAFAGHWLAGDRFAICYRKSTPATVQSDLHLAQTLLDAIEGGSREQGNGGQDT